MCPSTRAQMLRNATHRFVPALSVQAGRNRRLTSMSDRILHKGLKAKVMTAEAAAALIPNGAVVGMSGFTGAGYPKAVPVALAKRAVEERLRGKPYRLDVLTGASTGPEQDTAMSMTEDRKSTRLNSSHVKISYA